MNHWLFFRHKGLWYSLLIVGVSAGLYLTSIHNYLLFHTVAEGFSIVVAVGMFMVAWHTRKYTENSFLLLLGFSYFTVAGIDFLHSLAYRGMGIFEGADTDIATQFWVAARYIQSVSLLVVPFFLHRRIRSAKLVFVYLSIATLVVASIAWWEIFPHCFIPGEGLTLFKKISEYAIAALFLGALGILYRKKTHIDTGTFRLLTASIVITIFSELSFTLYRDPYSFSNLAGHLLKILAFFLTYRAVVVETLEKPYGVLFNNLTTTNARLHASREHFRKLFELSGVGKAETDLVTGRFVRVNQRLCEITGYSEDELLQLTTGDITFPEDRESDRRTIEFMLGTERKSWNTQKRYRRKDGTIIWVEVFGTVMDEVDGASLRCLADITDITEQYQKKQALERTVVTQAETLADTQESLERVNEQKLAAEEQLRQRHLAIEAVYTIITSSGSMLSSICDQVVTNIAAILKLQSVVLYQLADGRVTSPVQYRNGTVLHEEGLSVPCSACRTVLTSRKPFQCRGDLLEQFPDSICFDQGEFRSYIAVPVHNYDGGTVGMICAMRLEEREFQLYEVHLIEIFARYVAYEISRRALEKKMLQSQEMTLLGQLTSGVAHEVRNPLNALMAISEALFKKMGDTEAFSQYMTHIRNQIKRLSRLMEDLLALGRPLRKDDFSVVTVGTLLSGAIADWVGMSPDREKKISLMIQPASPKVSVNIDVTKMQQVVVNILDNAEYHSAPDGKIVVTFDGSEASCVRIFFRDNGSGVSEEDLKRVFDPFFTTRKAGTGLGLSIVKKTVESHGGSISIFNNSPLPGVTVEILLPVFTG